MIAKQLSPENEIERAFLQDPEFNTGLNWGIPRYGHPEGEVYKHILEVLDNIDRLPVDNPTRQKLRLIAFVHDTFKYKEDKSIPRDWTKHHAVFARKFAQKYIKDPELLKIIELHDNAYHCWQLKYIYKKEELAEFRLQNLLEELGNSIQLYYLFFKCDTMTGDKNLEPLKWFEENIPNITVLPIRNKP